MIDGWLSLRVRNPKEVGAWYVKLGLEVIGGRPDNCRHRNSEAG